ncbi:MAG TPA: CHAT domain-containing tetratricopeptide repeat protein, partial [Pyrinomonadaceae bacterium]|nr:CHAT domain-containing tetratricopeptide repeat protein [Pyrinomonadaceae bacterium]
MSHFSLHLVARGVSFFCGLLFAAQPHNASPRVAAMSVQAAEPVTLVTGRVLRREIGGSEVHAYAFELREQQHTQVSVNQQGTDVVIRVFDAEGGRTTVDRPNGSRGREVVSHVARRGGAVRVEVRTLERSAPRGHYEITLGEPRPATARDESRLAAEAAVSEAERLRARKTAASLPQALEKFSQATALWRALDEPYEAAVALYGRCLTRRLLGDNEAAAADCSESAAIMHSLGDEYGEAAARTGRAWAYIYLGDTDKAFADFTTSLAVRRHLGDRQGEALDLLGVGWAHALCGGYELAVEFFQQSLQALEETGDPRGRPIRLAAIGEVYRRTNRAAEAVEYLKQSLALSRAAHSGVGEEQRDRGGEAETLTGLGWCRYALGQLGEAHAYFTEALPIRRATGDSQGEAITLLGLAHVERAQGNLYNARLNVEAALGIIESLRARVANQPLRLSFFALAQDYYEFYVDLLMHMHRLDPRRGFDAAALGASERARARSLLDLLNETGADLRQGVSIELVERERDLRARLNAAASYQRQILSEGYTAAQAAAAAKDVDELATALSEVESRIRQASPRYAALTQPQPLSAADIRREIGDADTLLLEYSLGRERSFLWAVSPSDVTAYELPGRQEIERAAARVLEMLTARNRSVPGETPELRRTRVEAAENSYREAAMHLSRMVLGPAAARLGSKRLVVAAAGKLQLVPFGALPSPAGEGAPLILSHELITLPSASTLALLRRESARRERVTKLVTILADPVFSRTDERLEDTAAYKPSLDAATPGTSANSAKGEGRPAAAPADRALPRLFRTRWEAEQIAALVPPGQVVQSLDFEASREAATGPAVSGSRILHFATHAILDDVYPELSGVALSMFDMQGRPRDGFLRVHDIFNLKLSADLVILSACRTALGREYRGEGLVGLTRGF